MAQQAQQVQKVVYECTQCHNSFENVANAMSHTCYFQLLEENRQLGSSSAPFLTRTGPASSQSAFTTDSTVTSGVSNEHKSQEVIMEIVEQGSGVVEVSGNEEHREVLWPPTAVKILIGEMAKNEKLQMRKKKQVEVMQGTSKLLVKAGFNLTPSQCSNKWKYLKQQYKEEKDRLNQSGEGFDPETLSEYFGDLDEFLSKNPSITPMITFSSTGGKRKTAPVLKEKSTVKKVQRLDNGESSTSMDDANGDAAIEYSESADKSGADVFDVVEKLYGNASDSDSEDTENSKPSSSKKASVKKLKKGKGGKGQPKSSAIPSKKRNTASGAMITYMSAASKKREEARDVRHAENKEIMKQFLNVFQDMNNNLKAKNNPEKTEEA